MNTPEDLLSPQSTSKEPLKVGIFKAVIGRDITAAFRHPSDLVNPLIFFVVVITLFPLAVSSDSVFLSDIAPGVLWVSALLAT